MRSIKSKGKNKKKKFEKICLKIIGREWWLMPVLPLGGTSEGRGRWITRSRARDHPGQDGETPSLLQTQKLAGHGGACL